MFILGQKVLTKTDINVSLFKYSKRKGENIMKLKNNKGVTGVDIAISVLILIIFVSLIAGLFYNMGITSKKIDRKAEATNLAIGAIERMKLVDFADLENTKTNDDDGRKGINESNIPTLTDLDVPNGYKVEISVEDYDDGSVAKIIRAYVTYMENNQNQEIKIETIKKVDNGEKEVPIPAGFVVSGADGENDKEKGLVIYEGTEPVTNSNVETARKTRNQFVWIPTTDYNTKDYDGTGKTYTDNVDSNSEEEQKNIEKSIKKYGGYFVSRYEIGEKDGKPVSMRGYEPETNITPTNAIAKAREMYSKDSSWEVTSTPVYGKQWDNAMAWIKKTYNTSEGSKYGNYCDFNRQNIGKTFSSIMFDNKNNSIIKSRYLPDGGVRVGIPSELFTISTSLSSSSTIMPSYETTTTANLIINCTGKSYIRVKVAEVENSENIKSVDFKPQQTDKWVKRGDYWYYTEIVGTETLTIPVEIINNVNNTRNNSKDGIIHLYASATQSVIQVDFDSDKPWVDYVEIEGKNNQIKRVSDIKLAYLTESSTSEINYSVSPNTSEVTGYSDAWKINNLYDIAGNMAEITAEKTGDNYIIRGGKYFNIGNNAITKREEISATTTDIDTGYRIALYVK